MSPKLLLVILSAAATAAALLVVRQRRVEVAHEMAALHAEILAHERSLWELRVEIARRCHPEEIERMRQAMPVDWRPVPAPDALRPAGTAPRARGIRWPDPAATARRTDPDASDAPWSSRRRETSGG